MFSFFLQISMASLPPAFMHQGRNSRNSHFQSLEYSDPNSRNSPYGFQSIQLEPRSRKNSDKKHATPEAWLVFPKGGGRSIKNGQFTAKPINLACKHRNSIPVIPVIS